MANPWADIIGDDMQGLFLRNALMMIKEVDPEKIREGIQKLDHATTMGPMLDPTAWMGGERFDNARDYRQTLELVLPIAEKLKELEDNRSGLLEDES